MEDNFNWQEGRQPIYEHMPSPKKDGFGKGVLTGVLCTLAVVLVLGAAAAGIFMISGAETGSADSRKEGQKEPGQLEAEQQSEETDDNLLNVELISQISMIASYLDQSYLYEIDKDEVRTGMLKGLVASLGDPYSQYFDEEELASFQDSTEGEYVGIGAAVTQERDTGLVRVSRPYEGTPSAEAGLLPGDILVSVDGEEVTGMDLNQVVSLIKGEEGTKVTLNIYRETEEAYSDIQVERRKVEIPTVNSEMLEGNIGYIEVTSFDRVTSDQFISAYENLKNQGMERIIVDLRDNGGGLVDAVEAMLDYLLPEGVIFYAKDKDGNKSMEYSSDAEAALDIPMVVLVNGNTASAAEVFSGNIQAFGVGKIVGTTTYGKGVMQQLFYTNAQRTTAVKFTVGDYYIHSDKNINGSGITPDVEEELNQEAAQQVALPKDQDNQLQKAIEVVSGL